MGLISPGYLARFYLSRALSTQAAYYSHSNRFGIWHTYRNYRTTCVHMLHISIDTPKVQGPCPSVESLQSLNQFSLLSSLVLFSCRRLVLFKSFHRYHIHSSQLFCSKSALSVLALSYFLEIFFHYTQPSLSRSADRSLLSVAFPFQHRFNRLRLDPAYYTTEPNAPLKKLLTGTLVSFSCRLNVLLHASVGSISLSSRTALLFFEKRFDFKKFLRTNDFGLCNSYDNLSPHIQYGSQILGLRFQ